jgi:hypothetical protein
MLVDMQLGREKNVFVYLRKMFFLCAGFNMYEHE